MSRLTDAALRASEALEPDGPDRWNSPMVWTSDIERSPCWWPVPGLLEVITPGRRIYYRRDELEEVGYL